MRCLNGITDSTDMSVSKLQEMVMGREAWRAASPWDPKESHRTECLDKPQNSTHMSTSKIPEVLVHLLPSFSHFNSLSTFLKYCLFF